ncbi:carbon-nitrogen family hydrolase [Staphylococcus hyicus]|uniref:carbon-nitrogen family hydrolase n=1 Tax=Staphylococcus hyicus TaxID=1284 RepID=UPI002739AD3D|nr:carbon-nitrogen family hydrolase [Staphylococcus hyicus]MDP4462006.1 carbon-nitrogen family hydrolase [Staphylococcus hyicus]
MKIQILQFNVEPQSPSKNIHKIQRLFSEHVSHDTDVVVLPEMWNNGYSLSSLKQLSDRNLKQSLEWIQALARQYSVDIIAGSVSNQVEENLYNTAFAVDQNGHKIYEYHKIHLVPMLNEPTYLDAGTRVPYTFHLSDGTPVSQIICYDLRFPELTRYPAANGTQIMFYVAQWPEVRKAHWRKLLQARAIENDMFVVAANTCGSDGETSFAGHSMIINPNGEILKEADHEETVLTVDINLNDVQKQRINIPVFDNLRPDIYEYFNK